MHFDWLSRMRQDLRWVTWRAARPKRAARRPLPLVAAEVQQLENRVLLTVAEFEPNGSGDNDTRFTAQGVAIVTGDILTTDPADWQVITGTIFDGTDVDFYTFTLTERAGVFFDLDAQDIGSALDSVVQLFDSTGALLVENDQGYDFDGFAAPLNSDPDASSNDSSLYIDLLPGTYFVGVSAFSSFSSGDYELRLLADTTYTSAAPVFNSLPGAADTLYLDFNGHAATDAWGSYSATAFTLNSDATEFNPAERLAMYNLWRVTAEDYSPYNINVSTVDPGSFADGEAFRVVITTSPPSIAGQPSGTPGAAFIGSYATGGAADNVGFVFANSFGAFGSFAGPTLGNSGRIVATSLELGNTASQQFGRALGLNNYSSDGAVAGVAVLPNSIMAVPDLGLNREVFGEGVAQGGDSQDDDAVISGSANTFGRRPADHGDSIDDPGFLIGTAAGVIEAIDDVDVFRFVASGSTTITLDIDEYSANLNPILEIFNESGTSIGLASSVDPADRTILLPGLAAGVYYAQVRSNGGLGEQGQYTLLLNTNVTNTPPALDLNGAGTGADVTATFVEGAGPTGIIGPDPTITDADSASIVLARITLTNLLDGAAESLSADTTGTSIDASFLGGVLTLSGIDTRANYEQVLRTLRYDNTSAGPNTTPRIVEVLVSDGITFSNAATATVDITETNSPPLHTVPGPQVVAGAPLTFSTANGNAIVVNDPDAGASPVQVTLTATNGRLTLFTTIGLTFQTGDGVNDATMTFRGTLAVVNAALDGLMFIPIAGGAASLRIVTNDLGNTGIGDPLTDDDTITLTVTGNQPPVNIVPPAQTVVTGSPLIFSPANGNRISVSDPDAGATQVRVSLTATNGLLTFSRTTGLTFLAGDGLNDTGMTFTGSISAVNLALNTLRFMPNIGYIGSAILRVETNDQGGTGFGGPQTDVDTIAINIVSIPAVVDLNGPDVGGVPSGTGFSSTFVQGGGPVAIVAPELTVIDPDGTILASASVTLTNRPDGDFEILSVDTTGTAINTTFIDGVLRLTGTDTAINYQRVLRTLRYNNTAQTPVATARLVDVVVNDGTSDSIPATAQVEIQLLGPPQVPLNITSLTAVPAPANEGDGVTLTGVLATDRVAAFRAVIDWGDGSPQLVLDLPSGQLSFTASHVYRDNRGMGLAGYTITVDVTDPQNLLQRDTETTTVMVNNVAPVITSFASIVGDPADPVNFNAQFVDPGVLDTHTATIDFGDGTGPQPVTIQGRTILANHQYGSPGNYTVTLRLTDKDLGQTVRTTTVSIGGPLDTDPLPPDVYLADDNTSLVVIAGAGKDRIKIKQKNGELIVKIRGSESRTFTIAAGGIQQILIYRNGGSDRIRVSNKVNAASFVDPITPPPEPANAPLVAAQPLVNAQFLTFGNLDSQDEVLARGKLGR